jgi:four helix bundle protein
MPSSHPADLRERVFAFVCEIMLFCRRLSKESGTVRQIAWQLADAASSTGANLEEAKAAYSRRDFAAKNAIALKEMREALYWLRIISSCNLAESHDVQPLLAEANELTAMLTAGMKRLHPIATVILPALIAILLSVPLS